MALHLPRRALLAQLARQRLVAAVDEVRVHVADEQLRDGARAARPTEEIVLDGACDADHVHAVVLVESLVLAGNERFAHILRERADGDARAPFRSDLADEGAVARIDQRGLRRRDDLPRLPGAFGGFWRRRLDLCAHNARAGRDEGGDGHATESQGGTKAHLVYCTPGG